MEKRETEFERQCRLNRGRADIQRLNRELRDDGDKDIVQTLNNSVAILTGRPNVSE